MSGQREPGRRTLQSLLGEHAAQRPDATFVHDAAGTLTWGAALELARRQSAAFAGLGLGHGDTVAIMLDNRREFLASWFGLACLGAIEVPVNPQTTGDRLIHVLNQSRCRAIVVQSDRLAQLDAVAERLPRIESVVVVGPGASTRFRSLPFAELEGRAPPARRPPVSFSDPVAVMFTSGSTGPPKGAILSHGQHYTNGHQPSALFDIGPQDTLYVCLPLHHNMAQGYGVCVSLVSGAALHLATGFDADAFWPDVQRHGSTILPFVGAMLVLLAKREPGPRDAANPLRVAYGVPVPAYLHDAFARRFGLLLAHGYGSTEATIVSWNDGASCKPGSAGRPLPEFDVQIVDRDDVPVPTGELGEICVRPRQPSSMFSGYIGEPERTVAAWRNLWFHTGDRGWFDPEGELWFGGRAQDTVRHMGEFVSTHEVEEAIVAHPDVKIAAAFGVPSELIEEEVMVAVVLQPGSQVDPEALRNWCAERIPRGAVPRFVDFCETLPMTPTGKIEKFKLRQRGVTVTTYDARRRQEVLR